jgi:hypothetical protein
VSAAVCATTSFALSKSDTKSAPALAVVAGGTGLFTLGGALMASKQHYVYNKAFKETGLESIKSPADQRKLLKKMEEYDGSISVTDYIFRLQTKES